MPIPTSRISGELPDDYCKTPEERERLRRRVNHLVSHLDDPAKRARVARNLTWYLSTLEPIPEEDRVSYDA
jgi:hypothetical protein